MTFDWLREKKFRWLTDQNKVLFNKKENSVRAEYNPMLVEKTRLQVFIEDNPKKLVRTTGESLVKKILFKRVYNDGHQLDTKTVVVSSWFAIDRVVQGLKK